jgi:hypothetical protein
MPKATAPQYTLTRALAAQRFGLFIAVGVEGSVQLIFPNRAGLSTRMRAIKAAADTGCIMFVFEAAKQALYPKPSTWVSHTITILFTTLAAAVVIFAFLKKEAEGALRQSEIQYRILFDSNPLPCGFLNTRPSSFWR